MKFHRCGLLLLTMFFAICTNAQLITFLRGTSYNVSLTGSNLHFRIPIELAKGIDSSKLKVVLVDTHSERLPDQVPITVFGNVFIADTLGNSFLNIDINNSPAILPAAYVLTIRTSKKPDDGTAAEKYTLTITVNAAVIATPATVVVERTGRLKAGYDCTDTLLYLRETGRKSALTEIKLRPIKISDDKNRPVSGQVLLRPGQQIFAGETAQLSFETVGNFPIGKTTASMEITGSQLVDPLPLTIEITTRRSKYFLIGLLLTGLAMGWITRILLTRIIDLNAARLPGIELLAIIESAKNNRLDPSFVLEARNIETALKAGLRKTAADAVTKAVNDAKENLDKAIIAFNTQFNAAQQAYDLLKNTVSAVETLPSRFAGVNADIAASITDIQFKLSQGYLTDADKLTKAANIALANRFYPTLKEYRQDYLNLLNDIRHASFTIPEIKEESDQITIQVSGIEDTPRSIIETSVFPTLHGIEQKSGDLLYSLARALRNSIASIIEGFKPVEDIMPDPDSIEALGAESKAIIETINGMSGEPQAMLRTLPDKLAHLKASLRNSFMIQTDDEGETNEEKKKANQAARDAIEKEIVSGNYLNAATAVIDFIKSHPGTKRGANFDAENKVIPLISVQQPAVTGWFSQQRRPIQMVTTILPQRSGETEFRFEKVERVINAAKITQGVLVGGAIVFVGYTLNEANFVGTTPEIASIFFWAFLINISLSTLTDGFFSKIIK